MVKTLADYIMVFNDVLPWDMREGMMKAFDETSERVKRDNDVMNFEEINILTSPAFVDYKQPMTQAMLAISKAYKKRTNAFWPDKLAFEAPRIKRYEPNVGKFDWHIDADTAEKGKRLLVMFWYLNDVIEGGETEFDLNGVEIKVPAKGGSVACFPPNFMYPHRGATPTSEAKYVVSSYIQLP